MKNLYSAQSAETISLTVEQSPMWELILGIAGYTHKQLRHTFDLDESWSEDLDSMPRTLIDLLNRIEETNLWYGMILLQNKFSSSTVQQFTSQLNETQPDSFYDYLFPYKDRDSEAMRKTLAQQPQQESLLDKYADLFEGHDYLDGYIRQLGRYSQQEVCDLLNNTLSEWEKWITLKQDWEKWMQALSFEQKQYGLLDINNPTKEIERVTGGAEYLPEPSVWSVKLIPQVSYRPWVLTIRTPDTKLFFYPLNETYFLEPGVPSNELIRGHKALGDELRLKLLFTLKTGPLSLQELSVQFNTSKPTLHHQLSLLKAEKFIRVEKGIYSINLTKIDDFSGRLAQYLENIIDE